jgi:hypothetical protein
VCSSDLVWADTLARPICAGADAWPVSRALTDLTLNGNYDIDEKQLSAKDIATKVIGFKKIGKLPLLPGDSILLDPDSPPEILYQLIQYLHVSVHSGKQYGFIVMTDVSTRECAMSTSLIMEIFPKQRIVGNWESYAQSITSDYQKMDGVQPNLVGREKE